jgi:uncharacterized protein (TIGR02271 family)
LAKQRDDRFAELEDRVAGYTVYDVNYEKIGKVDDLFVDEDDNPEYIGVKMGFLGTRSTLIPVELVRVNERRGLVEVGADKDMVKGGPGIDDDEEITPEYEGRVHAHYGLGKGRQGDEQRGAYGDYYESEKDYPSRSAAVSGSADQGRRTTPGYRERRRGQGDGLSATVGDTGGEDELRVQRLEEELQAGTREREAGAMRVRKRVRTDREQVSVPTRHEEVSVERVPVDQEGTGAEIGEDEVSVPVVEEEVVVDKRPVVKEEIRVRKDVVEDEEVVEEDVRKEEVEVDDQTTTRGRGRETDLDDQTGRGR